MHHWHTQQPFPYWHNIYSSMLIFHMATLVVSQNQTPAAWQYVG